MRSSSLLCQDLFKVGRVARAFNEVNVTGTKYYGAVAMPRKRCHPVHITFQRISQPWKSSWCVEPSLVPTDPSSYRKLWALFEYLSHLSTPKFLYFYLLFSVRLSAESFFAAYSILLFYIRLLSFLR